MSHPLRLPLTAVAYGCAWAVAWLALSRALRHPHGAIVAVRQHRLG